MSAHWVYRCFDSTGRLVYVGCTSDLFGRLTAHRDRTWWAPQVAKVTATVHADRSEAGAVERAAIASENPRWNVMGRWASRFGWTIDDYRDYLTAYTARRITSDKARHIERVESEIRARFGTEAAA